MKTTTELEAIRSAVRKWSMIVHLNGIDKGDENCDLCKMHKNCNFGGKDCPVITLGGGSPSCGKTPYESWVEHQRAQHPEDYFGIRMSIQCPECRVYAQAELMFLQNVLEKYKGDNHERM